MEPTGLVDRHERSSPDPGGSDFRVIPHHSKRVRTVEREPELDFHPGHQRFVQMEQFGMLGKVLVLVWTRGQLLSWFN